MVKKILRQISYFFLVLGIFGLLFEIIIALLYIIEPKEYQFDFIMSAFITIISLLISKFFSYAENYS